MKKTKLTAVITAVALILPQFILCSCTAKKTGAKIYTEDTPWYSVEYSDIAESEGERSQLVYAGESNGNYVFVKNIDYPIPDGVGYESALNKEYYDAKLIICDKDLAVQKEIELNDYLYENGHEELANGYFYADWGYSDDEKITLQGSFISCETFERWTVTIDPVSYEASVSAAEYIDAIYREYSSYDAFGFESHLGNGKTYEVGTLDNGDNCTIAIALFDENGEAHITEVSDILPTVNTYEMYDPIVIDEDHAVAKLKTYGESEDYWIELDFADCSVKACKDDMSYLDGTDISNTVYSPSIGPLAMNDDGIFKIDTAAGSVEQIFSFDWCNINRSMIDSLEVLSADDNSIILCGTWMVVEPDHKVRYDSSLMKLTKCETNPNVGKTIVTVASLDDIDPAIATAVCDFNETNEEYFIVISDEYNTANYGEYSNMAVVAEADDSLEMEVAGQFVNEFDPAINDFYLNAASNMSYGLMVDLMAGEGPDIILNGASYNQLYSDEYLIDLSSYLEKSDVKIMDNILQLSKTGDKLYQIPLTFTITGLDVEPGVVADGQTGFTFEQYEEYVSGACNGTDPMMMTQLDFLTTVIRTQPELFISDGEVNFDNDAFKEACAYAKDNVIDPPEDPEEAYEALYELNGGLREIDSFSYLYYSTGLFHGNAFVGTPSSDGSGPVANIKGSVAISAQSQCQDGCWQFIEYILSDDVLPQIAGGIPVTETAFDARCEEELADYSDYYNAWTESERQMLGLMEPCEDMIDIYRDIVASVDRKNVTDSSIMIIMREEIQAYFAGDKSLDEVIEIINNRARTYYGERG
jgi:ABC-type glycerol-3-phosphate transport system substrate-binding protein